MASGEWIINGVKDYVVNAPIAALFAVLVKIPGQPMPKVLLVPADAPGLTVRSARKTMAARLWWRCDLQRLPGAGRQSSRRRCGRAAGLRRCRRATGMPLFQALNLGIGRAAYEAALDYARLRVQGGRPLIEHQAIGTKLAEIAIRLEVARATRSGRRPGRRIIPRRSPTAACPICRCRRSHRSLPPK